MGYITLIVKCFICKNIFGSNPDLVPCIRIEGGEKQEICEPCLITANQVRKAHGLEEWNYSKEAYQPQKEEML